MLWSLRQFTVDEVGVNDIGDIIKLQSQPKRDKDLLVMYSVWQLYNYTITLIHVRSCV